MSDDFTFSPVKTAPTTVPNNTHVEVPYALGDGVLVYRPEDNSLVALYADEWVLVRAEAHENMTAIDELQAANRAVTDKSLQLQALLQQPNAAKAELARAKLELDTALDTLAKKSEAAKSRVEAIGNQATDANKLVELVPLTMRRHTRTTVPLYVSVRHVRRALDDRRVYLIEGAGERERVPKEKLFHGATINHAEVRRRLANQVQDRAKFEKKWKLAPKDAEQFGGILTDWAKVMGTSATAFLERSQKDIAEGMLGAEKLKPNDPHRNIDLKPEAQFLRWSGGAGAEAIFMPFQGSLSDRRDTTMGQRFNRTAKAAQFSLKANAEASFALGEAKIETTGYLPHAAGWHLYPVVAGQAFDLGFFRLRADLKLFAMAGASLTLEAGAALMLSGDRQGLVGRPSPNRLATAKVGSKGEAKVFAGLKEGVELAGAVQWLNPEGFVDLKAPKKVDPNKVIAEYVDVASARCEASLIQGLAGTLGFECDYRQGNFVIAAKAGVCLGLGGAGSVAGKVGVAQIAQFFLCIAHQLKQADYRKMTGLMQAQAFDAYNKIFYFVVTENKNFEDFVGVQINELTTDYEEYMHSIRQKGDTFIQQLYKKMIMGWGPYAYMPPESRSVIIANVAEVISEPHNLHNLDLRANAAFVVNELLSTTQSLGHLHNTIDRINLTMGEESGRQHGVQLINSVVRTTIFSNCLNRCEFELAAVTPLQGRPFLRNDTPDICLAKFPLHHPAYPTV